MDNKLQQQKILSDLLLYTDLPVFVCTLDECESSYVMTHLEEKIGGDEKVLEYLVIRQLRKTFEQLHELSTLNT